MSLYRRWSIYGQDTPLKAMLAVVIICYVLHKGIRPALDYTDSHESTPWGHAMSCDLSADVIQCSTYSTISACEKSLFSNTNNVYKARDLKMAHECLHFSFAGKIMVQNYNEARDEIFHDTGKARFQGLAHGCLHITLADKIIVQLFGEARDEIFHDTGEDRFQRKGTVEERLRSHLWLRLFAAAGRPGSEGSGSLLRAGEQPHHLQPLPNEYDYARRALPPFRC